MTSQATIDRALAKVRDFVQRAVASGMTVSSIARAAGIDNKSIVQALQPNWNPTAGTLRKMEGVLPASWMPGDPLPERLGDAGAAASSSLAQTSTAEGS